jgi:hypothetical protein
MPDVSNGSIGNEVTGLRKSGLIVETGRDGRKPVYALAGSVQASSSSPSSNGHEHDELHSVRPQFRDMPPLEL